MAQTHKEYLRVLRNRSTTLHLKLADIGDQRDQEIVVCNSVLDVPPRALLKDQTGIWETLRNRKGRFFFIKATQAQMDELNIPKADRSADGFRNPVHMLEDVTAQFNEIRHEQVDMLGAFEAQKDLKEKAAKVEKLAAENTVLADDRKRLAAEKEELLKELAALKAGAVTEAIKSSARGK